MQGKDIVHFISEVKVQKVRKEFFRAFLFP